MLELPDLPLDRPGVPGGPLAFLQVRLGGLEAARWITAGSAATARTQARTASSRRATSRYRSEVHRSAPFPRHRQEYPCHG